MKSTFPSYLFSLTLFCCCFVLVKAQTDDDKFAIKDCRGRDSGICLTGECVCEEWQIQLFKKDGRDWGLITGKTLDSVKRQLKKSQDFDVSYARFFNQSVDAWDLNYQRPGKPICKTSCPSGSARRSRSKAEQNRRDEIIDAADDLIDKMIKEAARITSTLAKLERKGANPFKSVGRVLKDYANVFKDVLERQKELREKLAGTSDALTNTMADIENFYRDLQTAGSNAQKSYNELPDNARNFLETGEMPAIGGDWNNQRVRDFNNSVTQQTIDFNQNQITVSLKSVSDSNAGSVTYNLTTNDIVAQSISVQSTNAPDRWMVTFNTNGRKITKRTDRQTDSLTDNVSKMALFFSSEEAAKAAAEALGSIP